MENNNTYTYTARNANDIDKVVTFTLYDGHMRVGLTGLLDQAQTVAHSDEKPDELKHQVSVQARPALLKLKEELSGPVDINDVNVRLNGDRFRVTMWPRMGGLRLAPVSINMGQIDNQDAAEAFVDELDKRKEARADTRRFLGPLDYWFGWMGMLLLIGFLIRRPSHSEE